MIVVDFKVGDRVRFVMKSGEQARWDEVTVTRVDSDNYVYAADADGIEGAWHVRNVELIEAHSTDELTALRAFKETALASGYVPPEPPKPETDEEAAERFKQDFWNCSSDGEVGLFIEAFAWARANPR